MMRRLLPHPVLSVFLWLIWLLLNNTMAAGHVVLGAVLAVFIPWLSSAFWPEQVCIKKPLVLLRYILVVLWSIIVANINVARLILGRSDKLQPGFISLELRLQSPVGISMLSNTISLTPGTVSCDLSDDRRYLLIHALHIDDVEAIISDIQNRFEQPLLEIFES
ncbi:cation antiporter [Methylophaga lonarensis MPL]|uniref:Cation antiporter n=1 Tax=Methylophaga lonarensis MPL TaxID=1286106 RepID=M7PFY5_9GAMM|nr:Na+/H+ antiporter subunit E [Methylophaga lonarensis]EMR12770.1 cation antiporter [Methylophaga lonarensis MPL]